MSGAFFMSQKKNSQRWRIGGKFVSFRDFVNQFGTDAVAFDSLTAYEKKVVRSKEVAASRIRVAGKFVPKRVEQKIKQYAQDLNVTPEQIAQAPEIKGLFKGEFKLLQFGIDKGLKELARQKDKFVELRDASTGQTKRVTAKQAAKILAEFNNKLKSGYNINAVLFNNGLTDGLKMMWIEAPYLLDYLKNALPEDLEDQGFDEFFKISEKKPRVKNEMEGSKFSRQWRNKRGFVSFANYLREFGPESVKYEGLSTYEKFVFNGIKAQRNKKR